MNRTLNTLKAALAAALVLTLSVGCKDTNTTSSSASPSPSERKKTVEEVFNLAKAYSEDATKSDELKAAFATLTDEDLKKLAEKTEGDYNFTLYLTKSKLNDDTVAMLDTFLKKIDAAEAEKQVKATADSKSAFALLRDPARAAGDTADNLNKVTALIFTFNPAEVNNLKDGAGAFDAQAFNGAMAHMDASKVGGVVDIWLAGIMTNRPATQAAFKLVYPTASAENKQTLRSKLLAALYAVPATRNADLLGLVDATDPWGLSADFDTATYELDDGTGTKLNGNLLLVLAERFESDATAAGIEIADEEDNVLGEMVKVSTGGAITALTSDNAAFVVLEAVYSTQKAEDLIKVFQNLPTSGMYILGQWSAIYTTDVVKSSAGADVAIAKIFHDEHQRRGTNKQVDLRNGLINEAYALGKATDIATAVKNVAELITRDFFPDNTLRLTEFDPWEIGYKGRLLYVVLARAQEDLIANGSNLTKEIVLSIAGPLKTKAFPPAEAGSWFIYVNATDNAGPRKPVSILSLVAPLAPVGTPMSWLDGP